VRNRIKIIDALRGVAALFVLLHHFMVFFSDALENATNDSINKILIFISDLNSEAVLFFFIISGFCIGLSLNGSLPHKKRDVLLYIKKRFIRIMPIYFLALFITFLVGVFTNSTNYDSSYKLSNLLGNLFFLQTPEGVKHWFSPYGHNGPLWSLSYEMFFYLFFLPFSYFLRKLSLKNINLISFLLMGVTIISLALNHLNLFTPWFSFLSIFIIWYYGYLLFSNHVHMKRYDVHFIFLFYISIIICLNRSYIPSDTIYLVSKGLIMVSLLYSLIFMYRVNRVKIVLNTIERITIFLFYQIGLGSYALYAFHYVILLMCAYFKLTLIETIVILIISIICCIQLEKFIIKIASRFGSSKRLNKEIYPSH